MRTKLSVRNVESAKPFDAPYEIRDTDLKGLILRVQPSGVKSFVVQWGRGKRVTLKPRYPVLTLDGARTKAREVLLDADKHGTPEAARRNVKASTLREFLDEEFEPWATAHRKWGAGSVKRLKSAFANWLDKPLPDLDPLSVERWRSQRLKAGIAEGTVNRELAGLKSALAKAVQWKVLTAHPLTPVKLRRVDNARVRYLTAAEEKRLRAALIKRDRAAVAGRKRGNAHRASRGYELLPELPPDGYCDHLSPMVLLALNTGLRRGELTALDWSDINLRESDCMSGPRPPSPASHATFR